MNNNTHYEELLTVFFSSEHMGEYSLTPIQKACEYFGNPQNSFLSIHIAGTNGKGSVSKMIFQILKESGKKVGVYTSPHLIDIRERFETQDGCISQKEFTYYAEKVIDYGGGLSYFEKCVLVAFLYFRDQGLEYAVIETGLGGRLDATNIITPILSVITSIGYDHMEYLGNTLEEISFEKAGIIKTDIPLILYGTNTVIEKIALEKNARVIIPEPRNIVTNLLGEHQVSNACLASRAGQILGIQESVISQALLHVSHRGRLQFLSHNVLIDGAHNTQGLETLRDFLRTQEGKWQEIEYCFALKKGKKASLIFEIFPHISSWYLLSHTSPLLEQTDTLGGEGKKQGKEMYRVSPQDIFQKAQESPQKLFVIFGSLYALGVFLETY